MIIVCTLGVIFKANPQAQNSEKTGGSEDAKSNGQEKQDISIRNQRVL